MSKTEKLAAELSPAEKIAKVINERHGWDSHTPTMMTAEAVRRILEGHGHASHPITTEILAEVNRLNNKQPKTKKPRKK